MRKKREKKNLFKSNKQKKKKKFIGSTNTEKINKMQRAQMDGAKKKKKKHTNMNKCPYTNGALHTIYKIEIEQKTHTHTFTKRD